MNATANVTAIYEVDGTWFVEWDRTHVDGEVFSECDVFDSKEDAKRFRREISAADSIGVRNINEETGTHASIHPWNTTEDEDGSVFSDCEWKIGRYTTDRGRLFYASTNSEVESNELWSDGSCQTYTHFVVRNWIA